MKMGRNVKKREIVKENEYLQKQAERFKRKYRVTYGLLEIKQQKKQISDLIEKVSGKKIKTLAIYGTGELGEYLLKELLAEKQFTILYCLDKKQSGMIEYIPIFQPSGELEVPDMILITPIGILKEIEDVLYKEMHTWDTMSVEELFGA